MDTYEEYLKGKKLDELLNEARAEQNKDKSGEYLPVQQKGLDYASVQALNDNAADVIDKKKGLMEREDDSWVLEKNVSKYEVAKEISKKVSKGVSKGLGKLISNAYFAPTILRKEGTKDYLTSLAASVVAHTTIFGIGTLVGGLFGLIDIDDAPLIFFGGIGLPVVTNSVSGIYEYGRHSYLQAKEKIKLRKLAYEKNKVEGQNDFG